jgi:hypothetical protein
VVTNIFRYLNTIKKIIKITCNGIGKIIAFTDSDLGGDTKDKKSS